MNELEIKELITGIINYNYICPLPYNELDEFIKRNLSKYYFGNESLYDFYIKRGFNYHCQIGSLLCLLKLPNELECTLIRGELLSDIQGKMFTHGWIETKYKGKEYVIDTSIARAIPKDMYYSLYVPTVYTCIDKKDLLLNKYAQYFKEELNHINNLTLLKEKSTLLYGEGSWFDLYENNWLQDIDNNSKKGNYLTKMKKITQPKIKHSF